MKRTLIKNANIIDGSGSKAYTGSVLIEDERIIAVGDVTTEAVDEVIDAKGMVVCPGFIDTHSHSDLEVFKEPPLYAKVMQGITTEFLGQDGISMAPLPEQYISPWRKNLAGLDGDKEDLNWHYKDTAGYLKLLEENGSGTNLAYLIPHGNVRMEAIGLDGRLATPDELDKMKNILRRELKAGGFGLSTGLIYMPCAYGDTNEMVELCKVAAEFDTPLVIHQRSEADTIVASMEEVIEIGRKSGCKVHFSHFKICGKNNADKFEPVLNLLDEASKAGITVSLDQYPYVAGSTMLGVILPPWAHDGGTDKLLERLNNPADRKRMQHDIKNGIQGWDNFVQFAGLDGIYVTSVKTDKNQDAIGKNLIELGELRGKEPLEATFDLLYEEANAVGMVDFYGLEEHVKAFMSRPEMNVCTDGLLGGKPHPRVFGAFPRVLGKYVREEKVMPLEEAIRKMTSRPAQVFKVKDRGLLKTGYYADITIFNPETIIDKGTYVDPRQYPEGIEYVFVNGTLAVDKQQPTAKTAGKVLRLTD